MRDQAISQACKESEERNVETVKMEESRARCTCLPSLGVKSSDLNLTDNKPNCQDSIEGAISPHFTL